MEITLGAYRHNKTGDRYIIDHADHLRVHGQREFDNNNEFEPWSTRVHNFKNDYRPDVEDNPAGGTRRKGTA